MSMENGFELDLDCGFGCMPMDHGDIGEPDFASIDEFPRPFVPEEVREVGRIPVYRYLVEANAGNRGRLYDGEDAADAMAAWTKAILDGKEYVTIEALRRVGT